MCDRDTKTYHIEDLRRVVNWYDNLSNEQSVLARHVKIQATDTGMGTAITAYVEINKGEGLWKDLSDYENW